MNRRKFFTAFSVLTGAASLSPMVFIPKFEPVRWKRGIKDGWRMQQNVYTVIPLNPDTPLCFRDFYGKWNLCMDELKTPQEAAKEVDDLISYIRHNINHKTT